MLFTVVSIPALNLLLHLLNRQAHSELTLWLSTRPSACIFMLGSANAMAHVYYELLILDGHQAAFAWRLEFH